MWWLWSHLALHRSLDWSLDVLSASCWLHRCEGSTWWVTSVTLEAGHPVSNNTGWLCLSWARAWKGSGADQGCYVEPCLLGSYLSWWQDRGSLLGRNEGWALAKFQRRTTMQFSWDSALEKLSDQWQTRLSHGARGYSASLPCDLGSPEPDVHPQLPALSGLYWDHQLWIRKA